MTMKELALNGSLISVEDSEDIEDANLMEQDSSDTESSQSGQSLTFFSGTSSDVPRIDSLTNQRYKIKWLKLKRTIKAMIFENAALCDEVAQVQERILIAKEERRFLLKKYLSFQSHKEVQAPAKHLMVQPEITSTQSALQGTQHHGTSDGSDPKLKKKASVKKKPPKDPASIAEQKLKPKSIKKKKVSTGKCVIQPISLDSSGRPIFPIVLGNLTIHSLGEIISDRRAFHTENYILPVGYCSSRVYTSTRDAKQHCLYTCTIMELAGQPHFEIVPEDDTDHPMIGTSVDDCHIQLLKKVNAACGRNVLLMEARGADFFGLSHPIVQNLIQSCPGARKCTSYQWVKFEISRFAPPTNQSIQIMDNNPAVSLAAFRVLLNIKMESSNMSSSLSLESSSSPMSGFGFLTNFEVKQEPVSPTSNSHLY